MVQGTYTDGQWLCSCDLAPQWRTSKQPDTMNQRFLRCARGGRAQCGFFLWEDQEPEARTGVSPPTPTTSVRGLHSNNGLPTPQTGHTGPSTGSRSGRTVTLKQSLSPVPIRLLPEARVEAVRSIEDGDYRDDEDDSDGDAPSNTLALYHEVLDLLNSEQVILKRSTRIMLRHTLQLSIKGYETKMTCYKDTVEQLRRRPTAR